MPMIESGKKLVAETARAVAGALFDLHEKHGHDSVEVLRCALWHVAAYSGDGCDLFEEQKEAILIDAISCLNYIHGLELDMEDGPILKPPRLVE